MIRATNMAAALVNAIVKQDPKQKNWVSRTVIDRAMYTNIGNVNEHGYVKSLEQPATKQKKG